MRTLKTWPKYAEVKNAPNHRKQGGLQEDGYKHPWSKWADGRVHKITYADGDYDVSEATMSMLLRQHARKHAVGIRVWHSHDAECVVFQFLLD